MKNKPFLWLSLVFALLTIVGKSYELLWLVYLSKPLIVLSLIWHLRLQRFSRHNMLTLVFVALAFSWLGDVFLMFEMAWAFQAGLGAFLIAQLSYFLAFRKRSRNFDEKPTLFFDLLLSIPLFTFFFLFLNEILSFIEFQGEHMALYYPVMVYGIVIMLMGYSALTRYNRTSKSSYFLILVGAVSFIISDSILAWNMFRAPVEHAHLYIMSSYALAQFLIVKGTEEFMQESIHNT